VKLSASQLFRMGGWVPDGCSRNHELWRSIVVSEKTAESSDYPRNMSARDPSVFMPFINYDEFQITVKSVPSTIFAMSWQIDIESGGIRQDNVRMASNPTFSF
jgi:hypothetical protein